jgi:competence protein ComEA
MSRTSALAAVVLLAIALTVLGRWWWPSARPALDCAPELVGLDDAGVARCGAPHPLPAALKLTVGQKLDLNRAPAEELALVPGVGPSLANAIVEERRRRGQFFSWEEVDAVKGVGPARLEALRGAVEIRGGDAGP